jgi:hypothetical protein
VTVSGSNAIGQTNTDFTVITSNPAAFSITKTHAHAFLLGQTDAIYTVTVSNGASAGASLGAVTVTENIPSGLTLVSMAGTVWSCSNNTCTRSDSLAGGASYPPITVTVNVAANAVSPVVNGVSVSGGGSVAVSTTDTTVVGAMSESVSPTSGSGPSRAFTLQYTDPAGASDLSTLLALINSGLSGPNACDLTMDVVHNALYLLNDGATAWLGPVTPGTAGMVQNSRCVVNGANSSVVASGNTVTLNVALSFQPAFAGAKSIYANASTTGGLTAGWTGLGTWTVTGAAQPPQATSVTPSSGSGSSQTFSFVYTDAAGASSLNTMLALISSGLSGPSSCDLTMDVVHNALYLLNDGATAWLGPVTPGAAGTVQNSQCTVNGANSSAVASGNTVTLNLALSFQIPFAGAKNIYANASSTGGLTSGWTRLGTWTIP